MGCLDYFLGNALVKFSQLERNLEMMYSFYMNQQMSFSELDQHPAFVNARKCQLDYNLAWSAYMSQHASTSLSIPELMYRSVTNTLLAPFKLDAPTRTRRAARETWIRLAKAHQAVAIHSAIPFVNRRVFLGEYIKDRRTGTDWTEALNAVLAPSYTWKDVCIDPTNLSITGEPRSDL